MKSVLTCLIAVAALLAPALAAAQRGDDAVLQARDALRSRDKARLVALKAATADHPLAPWVDYWELGNRLTEAQPAEVEAFYARWSGSYVEDRLRNDWLLELGRRRDWVDFVRDYPRFRMNDDREVGCYALLTRHIAGEDVRDAARAAWYAQRELDDGCNLLASTLYEARRLSADDVWHEAQLSIENGRPKAARAAAALISPAAAQAVSELNDNPARFLARRAPNNELALLALMRLAANDPDAAATQLESKWQQRLTREQAALAWATTAKQAALKQQPQALDHYRRAWRLVHSEPGWSDDTLAWSVRAALRAAPGTADRWAIVQRSIGAMSAAEQREGSWVYWKARALWARSRPDAEGDADRAAAREVFESIAGQMSFYGKLASEELGASPVLPAPPQPPSAEEREAAGSTPGFARALQLIAIGLRSEGVREWNFTLRGLADRELLAAAQLACEREIWDRCIGTSDRTRIEVDMAQRFPTPFRTEVLAKSLEAGLDPAYVYGLIRQESRFVTDARSHAGATGLMQLMPATAKWTAKKIGVDYRAGQVGDRDFNLQLGAAYLRMVLDNFGGSQALAAAAYNAGPSRSRRWREGGVFEAAAWTESIPFNETRDYVKKVLSNAVDYAALLGLAPVSLKTRLGATIGPPDTTVANRDLP